MTTRGVDIRQSTDRIIFRVSLKNSTGGKVTSGTTELRLYRLEDDGSLRVYDWTTNAFVATGAGTPDDETTMSHQSRRDSSGADVATGIWTSVLSNLSSMTPGQIYIAQVTNSSASPESQEREFQFGDVEGDTADVVAAQSLAALNASDVVADLNALQAATATIDSEVGQLSADLATVDGVADTIATGVATVITSLATVSANVTAVSGEVGKIPRKATAIVAGAAATRTNTSITPNQVITEVIS